MADRGGVRADILEATGATVAVRDVSFEVERGRPSW
jgi:ABC-type proline/glycine betaine transport system ATPase subunit